MGLYRTLTLLTIILFTVGIVAADEASAPVPDTPEDAPVNLPTEPHQFFGSITINGQPAPNNLLVEAYIGEGPLTGGSPVGVSATRNGGYGYLPYIMMVVPQAAGSAGPIFFYLIGDDGNHYDLGEHPYSRFGITQLDFSISCTGCLPPVSASPSGSGGGSGGGGSGGGSGGAGSTSGTSTVSDDDVDDGAPEVCVPDWRCSEWTACTDNVRHRVCVDRNDCDVEDDMPVIRESCGIVEEEPAATVEEEPAQGNFLTGLVTGAGGLGALIFLVALGLIIAFVWRRRSQ